MAKKRSKKSKKGTAAHKKAVKALRNMEKTHKKLTLQIRKHKKSMQAQLFPFLA